MEQMGRVVALLPGGRAQVEIQRKAACASDCSKCGGCAHPEQIMAVEVPNACGAQVGEQVVIRARASSILSIAALVYLAPVVLMIGCYFLPVSQGEGPRILCSLAGLAAGAALCALYSRRVKTARRVLFDIERGIGKPETQR